RRRYERRRRGNLPPSTHVSHHWWGLHREPCRRVNLTHDQGSRLVKLCPRTWYGVPPLTERTDLMAKMTTAHLLRPPMAYLTDVSCFEGMAQVWAHLIQMCLQWQADMFKAAGPFATSWFERQLEAAYVVLENIEKFARCGDLAGAVAIQRQWS